MMRPWWASRLQRPLSLSSGATVPHSQVWPGALQSGTQRWVWTQPQRCPAPSTASHTPRAVASQPWLPSLHACRDGAELGPAVGDGVGGRDGWAVGGLVVTMQMTRRSTTATCS